MNFKLIEPGTRFGRLVVVELSYIGDGHSAYRCVCDCGKESTVRRRSLLTGGTQSCGCLRRQSVNAAQTVHGMTGTSELRAYSDAKRRCLNPKNKSYSNYGGRGIEFRFNSFEEWFAELGLKPTPDHSVDRIDNDGHYEPGNVRWATKTEQQKNRRQSSEWAGRGASK